MTSRTTTQLLVLGTVAALMFVGWREFWFLTDDSYIAFRYIANHMRGWGLTWNPPPFRPIEGYTSFLWLMILEATWRITGWDPPATANWLSLACTYGTLALGYRLVHRLTLPVTLARHRFWFAALVLVAAVTNTTFLAWSSSGLETALFVLLVTGWVTACIERRARPTHRNLAIIAATAALCALTRPDGYLLIAGTGLLFLTDCVRRRVPVSHVLALAPLLLVPAHLLFRYHYYGEWLPNTYVAKYVGAWPESGTRYAESFLLEYAWWAWLPLIVLALVRDEWPVDVVMTIVLGVLGFHAMYYTFIIGGDHFEYRIYAHLVVLLWVAAVALVARVTQRPFAAAGVLLALWAISLPTQWMVNFTTRGVTGYLNGSPSNDAYRLVRPIERFFPRPLQGYGRRFDELQAWLVPHFVGMRWAEHRAFSAFQQHLFPAANARGIPWRQYPVFAYHSVGIPGWNMRDLSIIDTHGLNDWVVARSALAPGQRRMAHDRMPPPGYVDCFRPDFRISEQGFEFVGRTAPLTQAMIRRCELDFSQAVKRISDQTIGQ